MSLPLYILLCPIFRVILDLQKEKTVICNACGKYQPLLTLPHAFHGLSANSGIIHNVWTCIHQNIGLPTLPFGVLTLTHSTRVSKKHHIEGVFTHGILLHCTGLSFQLVPGHCSFFRSWMAGDWCSFFQVFLFLLHTSQCTQKPPPTRNSYHSLLELETEFKCDQYLYLFSFQQQSKKQKSPHQI